MVICETTVRPTDGAVEHPRTDSLRVGEQMPLLRMVNSLRPPNLYLLSKFSILLISRLIASKGIANLKAVLLLSRYQLGRA